MKSFDFLVFVLSNFLWSSLSEHLSIDDEQLDTSWVLMLFSNYAIRQHYNSFIFTLCVEMDVYFIKILLITSQSFHFCDFK